LPAASFCRVARTRRLPFTAAGPVPIRRPSSLKVAGPDSRSRAWLSNVVAATVRCGGSWVNSATTAFDSSRPGSAKGW